MEMHTFILPLQSYPDNMYPSWQLQSNDPIVFVHICAHGPLPSFGRHSLMSVYKIFVDSITSIHVVKPTNSLRILAKSQMALNHDCVKSKAVFTLLVHCIECLYSLNL